MLKRILVIFLIMILVMSPVSVYASSSGTLTVASGSGSAVGGLFSDYGINSETSAIALTLVFLNSLGATVKLTDQAIQAGKKVEDVVMDKFAQWVGGSNAESMTEYQREELKKRFKVINGGSGNNESGSDGPNVGPDGKIYFGLGALGILTEFVKFLKSNNDIQDLPVSDPNDVPTVNLGPFQTVMGTRTSDNNVVRIYDSSVLCAIFRIFNRGDGSSIGACFICDKPFTVTNVSGGNIVENATEYHNYYYWQYWQYTGPSIRDFLPQNARAVPSDEAAESIIDQITQWAPDIPVDGVSEDGVYKGDNFDDSIVENPTQPIVVDPGLLPNVTPDTDQQVSISDYLQMILDNLNANASQSQDPYNVPVSDPVTNSPGTLTVPVQEQDPINQPLPAETVSPDDVPVNPVQDPSTPVEPGDALPRLTFPLDEYFPFCIPFDIYALLSKFSADPVTPVFDVGFMEPFTNSEVNLHIDLTPWNGVATAIRTAELGAFIVGLALLSKQIFTRG